jgi:hypothetical protein
VSAAANVVIIAAIITKVGPSTHDERHQAAPRPGAALARSCDYVLHVIVGQANRNRGGHAQGFVDAIDGMGLPLLQGRARKGRLMKSSLTGLIGHRAVK